MLPIGRFTEFIEQNTLFQPENSILVAVSGGMDSVLLAHLFKAAGYKFSLAHCNFGLRGDESDADQQFCNNLAAQLNVSFHTINFNTRQHADDNKVSIQMAARELRYAWFEQLKQQHGYHAIALGHHKNDTIETILLNLTRGTGIAGLHGILPQNGHLIRPLLFLDRQEIAGFIANENLPFVEDSSNASVKYARNKIRHEVIPKLKELNPNLENTFENNLRRFRELELLLIIQAEEVRRKIFVTYRDEIHIATDDLKALRLPHLLLFTLLQKYGFNETTVDDIISSLDAQPGKVFESASHQLVLDRGKFILTEKKEPVLDEVPVPERESQVYFPNYLLKLLHDDSPLIIKDNPLAVSIDAEKLIYPLTVRGWREGDFFYPLGMKGKQKLSDFFIHQKVPLHKKGTIPLLINGNGDIMWIGGYRPDERYKVSANTKKVTIFELTKLI